MGGGRVCEGARRVVRLMECLVANSETSLGRLEQQTLAEGAQASRTWALRGRGRGRGRGSVPRAEVTADLRHTRVAVSGECDG